MIPYIQKCRVEPRHHNSTSGVCPSATLYVKIAKAEKDIDEGKGQDAFEALDEIRAELNV